MPKVNPEILVWARESAGLSLDTAAKQAGFADSRRSSAVEKLTAIEIGEREPTRHQLSKLAEKYRRPLLTFYLSHPPTKSTRGADFRTLPGEHSATNDALLDALLRDVRVRQSMIRAALEDEDEAESLSLVGSHNVSDGINEVLASLHQLLGIGLREYRAQRNPTAGFALLRSRAEQAGVFVVVRSDLGTYHTAFEPSVFRGIAISDPVAPFIVINGRDARAAWSFTLLHELVHVLVGQTAVGNSHTNNENERFCDDVAAAFLLLPGEIQDNLQFGSNFNSNVEMINEFADTRNLSRSMVAYNAQRTGLINTQEYRQLSQYFRAQWKQQRERERQRNRSTENGPDYYVVQRHRIGRSMLNFTKRMMEAGVLSTSKAAKILGIKPKQVHRMLETTL